MGVGKKWPKGLNTTVLKSSALSFLVLAYASMTAAELAYAMVGDCIR
jgi:hypothetical protein